MTELPKVALLIGAGVAIFGTTAGLTTAVLHFRPSLLSNLRLFPKSSPTIVCKTIATDPNPPLNIRSSPVSAPDNIVAKLKNGTELQVVDENEGWLRIVSPVEGWVYKDLTVTSCISAKAAEAVSKAPDKGTSILKEATEFYQAGNLNAAIALAQTVPANSSSYQLVQGAIVQWQQDWKTSEAEFYTAQKAFREGRWQDVLNQVRSFPDNRFWRAKLTPMVREAIKHQNAGK
jgi:hypothetical protein